MNVQLVAHVDYFDDEILDCETLCVDGEIAVIDFGYDDDRVFAHGGPVGLFVHDDGVCGEKID